MVTGVNDSASGLVMAICLLIKLTVFHCTLLAVLVLCETIRRNEEMIYLGENTNA